MSGRDFSSILEIVRIRVEENSDQPVYSFLGKDGTEAEKLTWADLDRKARAVAVALADAGASGQRVMLLYPSCLEFIAAFLGCLYAGAVAVPCYPPQRKRPNLRLRAIAGDARPVVVLTTASVRSWAAGHGAALPELAHVPWIATECDCDLAGVFREQPASPETPAFLQYTSGSTSTPKGVIIRHGHLLHNEEMIRCAFEQSEDSVIVSWLPLFHDMGLIGGVLQPLYVGARCVLMSPVSVLERPARWLEAITRYRATTSGGPDFAYDLCVRRISTSDRENLDLSTWRVAFNGSEPVRAETLERFADAFGPHGFRRDAFAPCYGLAEATLLVTVNRRASPPARRRFDKEALENGEAVAASAGEDNGRTLVGCGHGWLGQRVEIVDAASGELCPPGRTGEIWISGPSVAGGYWQKDVETRRTFGATLANGDGPFLRTGDLGFVDGGELFVTGRLKDLIILRGRNLYPQDIELSVERCHPALRPASAAAFSIDRGGEERLVVVVELERRARVEPDEVMRAVRRALAEEHDVLPHEVVLARFGAVPKTSSGKVRRRACRRRYLSGELRTVSRGGHEAGMAAEAALRAVDRETLRELAPDERRTEVRRFLVGQLTRAAGTDMARLDDAASLSQAGLDSLAAADVANGLQVAFGVDLPLARLFDAGIGELCEEVLTLFGDSEERKRPALVAGGPLQGELPLSQGQRGLWFLHRLAPDSAAYNLAAAARVHSRLEVEALRDALQAVADRHPALATTFAAPAGEPRQRIGGQGRVDFARVDATRWSRDRLRRQLDAAAGLSFDLERGPLVRLRVYECSAERPVILLVLHHIVADYWSLGVLLKELSLIYEERTGGRAAPLVPLVHHYGDFIRWQEQLLAGPEGERLETFWLRQLSGELPVLDLATDRPRPAVQSYRGAALSSRLPAALTVELKALGRALGATPFMVLLSAFQVLLHRHTGQDDLLIGTPTSGRNVAGLEGVIGYHVNPVVLRSRFAGGPGFEVFLSRSRRRVLDAFENQDFPLPLLVERLVPHRDASRSPLFQAMFVFQKAQAGLEHLAAFAAGDEGIRVRLPGSLTLEPVRLREAWSPFDLLLSAVTVEGRLSVTLRYATDLFDATTMGRLLGHFETLLAAVASGAAGSVGSLPLLSAAERNQLLVEWNVDGWDGVRDVCLHDAFERRTVTAPDALALVAGTACLTYRELEARANRLASRLCALGVGPEVHVGVATRRSPEMLISLLAVLKSGAAYVPVDPAYPKERMRWTLEDARCPVVLVDGGLEPEQRVAGARWLRVDGSVTGAGDAPRPRPAARPENLAYVLYTSGSTGRPKGVSVRHRSAAALLCWAADVYGPLELAGVLASTSICFDLSVFELFLPLSQGGTVILVQRALDLAESPGAFRPTLINTVPSAMAELLRLGAVPSSVRTVNLAGEPLERDLADRVYRLGTVERLYNLYGPSEDTTYSTWARVDAGVADAPTIGRPVAGTRAFVVDRSLEPVAVAVAGELFLGGAGLARGYLGRPARTASVFVPDLFSRAPGERLYRTGDLARSRPDGDVEFLGRIDRQIKLRGFRIELGEVSSALLSHPKIAEAVATVREGTDAASRQLVAFVVAAGEMSITADELRRWLQAKLPGYMVPGHFAVLAAIPLLPNGKIDYAALHRQALPRRTDGARSEGPRTPLEELLVEIWAEVLGHSGFGVYDNFFDLGGQSLLATRVLSRLEDTFAVELPLSALFEAVTVADLAAKIETARRSDPAAGPLPLAPAPDSDVVPLSFAQERLWFLERLSAGVSPYHLAGAVRLAGALDRKVLTAGLNAVLARQEALRTVFPAPEGAPIQLVLPSTRFDLPVVDLGALPDHVRRGAAARQEVAESRRRFDVERGPLLRLVLFRLAAERHELLVVQHHLVSDGWSIGIWLRELAAHYGTSRAGGVLPLPAPAVRYCDFAVWQRKWLAGGLLSDQLEYWKRQLEDHPASLALPADRPRPPARSSQGAQSGLAVSPALADRLLNLSRCARATLFMTLLAGWQALLLRSTGQTDVLVGTPFANRRRTEVFDLIGCFVNTLVLRTVLDAGSSFTESLKRVRRVVLEAHDHQDVPFERLVQELGADRDLSRTPIFGVFFALQPPLPEIALEGLGLELKEVDTGTSKFDLNLSFGIDGAGLRGSLEYDTDLFDASTAGRLARHYLAFLEGAAADPERALSAIPLMSPAESHQLLAEWNDTAAPYPLEDCLHELFEAQAETTPERLALVFGGRSLSYRELDVRANRLARGLQELGVGPEVAVGVLMERSLSMVVALYGILKAGAAYLPLDPELPLSRLSYMAESTRTPVVLRGPGAVAIEGGWHCVELGDDRPPYAGLSSAKPAAGVRPENLAYVIFTSGSTGRPKGAMNSHRGIVNRLLWMQEAYRLGEGDRVLQKTPFSFDVSVWELFWPLLSGASLTVARPGGHRDALYLARTVSRHRTTTLHFVPSMLRAFLDGSEAEPCSAPRRVILSGEALTSELERRFFSRFETELHNLYGPTEAAVDVTFWACRPGAPETVSVPIGRPIANLGIHLLDASFEAVPVGVAGELSIGGVGLGRGYMARAGLTAERFVPSPIPGQPGARLYRTGDLVRRRGDGVLEYLGRIDHQVKVRGLRIELGEIEAVLLSHPDVAEAVVVAREEASGDRRLAAYVVGAAEAGVLESFLASALPSYMVPAAFVVLESMPRLANGKLDRRALPEPRWAGGERAFVAPRTPVEEILSRIWCELLGVERVGVEDSFFELGGHSLLATRVLAKVRRRLDVEVGIRDFFAAPTVAGLARAIQAGGDAAEPIVPGPRGAAVPLSLSQERLWLLEELEPGTGAYNMPAAVRLRGRLDVAALEGALRGVVERHEVLRARFESRAGRPVQRIVPSLEPALPVIDLSALGGEARLAGRWRQAAEEALRPFDLAAGPLLRAHLLRLAGDEHVLLLTLHHIVFDGWSAGVLVRDLTALYAARLSGEAARLGALEVQYADYVAWQRRRLEDSRMAEELAWWARRLGGDLPVLDLPTDRPRPRVRSFRGARRSLVLEPAAAAALHDLVHCENATLFMALLAAFSVLLSRLAGQRRVLVGSPIAGRGQVGTEDLIGVFLNMLALPVDLDGDMSFQQLLAQVRDTTLGAYAHQELPFERLLEELAPERDLSRTPLFQVLLNVLNFPREAIRLPGLEAVLEASPELPSKFDLTLYVEETETLRFDLVYNAELFDDARIEAVLEQLRHLLEQISARPERRLDDLSLRPASAERVLPDPAASLTGKSWEPVHLRFEREARRGAERRAVSDPAISWSYGELACRSAGLAAALAASGIGPGDLVAIYARRGAALVAAVLGVLEAGAAFVMLDADYPAGRVIDQLRRTTRKGRLRGWLEIAPAEPGESLAEHLLTLPLVLRYRLPAEWDPALVAASPHEARAVGGLPAYLAFTSGTTGRPKAVVGTHGPLSHFVDWQIRTFDLGAGDRFAMLSGIAHDPLLRDIFTPLCLGAEICVPEPEILTEPALLRGWMARSGVTAVHLTPALGRLLTAGWSPGVDGSLDDLRYLFFGGDVLTSRQVERWRRLAPGAAVIGFYGATETPQGIAWSRAAEDGGRIRVLLGRGIDGVQLLIVSPSGQAAGVGELGEICVRTPYLATGYLDDEGATARSFQVNPFTGAPSDRIYRTGDLGRYLPTGEVEFHGRADRQVQVRGFRVELAEVEGALETHPSVRHAVVQARRGPDDENRLVAWIAATRSSAPTAGELRRYLGRSLPEPMVPSAFVRLDALPLTPAGKIDTAALPEPDERRPLEGELVAARTPLEESLAEIWGDLLGVDSVGVRDNFFELGGNSLLGARLVARIGQELGKEVRLRSLFEAPTVEGLADLLEGGRDAVRHAVGLPRLEPDLESRHAAFPLTDLQQAYWVGRSGAIELGNVASHRYLELEGDLDVARLERAWNRLVERHDMLRAVVRPDGLQQVLAEVPRYRVEIADLRERTAAEVETELGRVRSEMSHRVQPAERWPLFEIRASRLGVTSWRIHFSFDYLIADAWSFLILGRELAEIYGDPDAELPPLELTFRDCVLAQKELEDSELGRRSWSYWQERVPELPPAPVLPLVAGPSSLEAPRFVRRSARLEADDWRRLRKRAARAGLTPSGALLAAYCQVLAAWSAAARFSVVLTLFNRLELHPQVHSLVGDFTSTTVVGREPVGGGFEANARRLQEQIWDNLDHRYTSGVTVVREMARVQGQGVRAMVPVVFTSLLEQSRSSSSSEAIRHLGRLVYSISQTPQVYLDHQAAEEDGALIFNWDAVDELFVPGVVDDMFGAYVALLARLAHDESCWRDEPPALLPSVQLERRHEADATAGPMPRGLLHTPFVERALRHPERPAVIDPRRTLSYGELLGLAGRIGSELSELGVRAGEPVPVVMEKGWEQVAAVLGILFAGGAYVPIDATLPRARRSHLLGVLGTRFALVQPWRRAELEVPDMVTVIEVTAGLPPEEPPAPASAATDLAYVIFTSGSTGEPKGVMIDHRGALNTIQDVNERFGVDAADRVLALSSLSFDLSVYDVFGTLAAGGAVVLPASAASRDPGHWLALLRESRVTLWNTVPQLMAMLVEHVEGLGETLPASLRLVLMSGDWIPVSLPERIRALAPEARIVSLGGATEASIWSILYPIARVDDAWASIPYGRAMRNQRVAVLDDRLEPRPDWVTGEIYIAGTGLALGYWRDADKTAASFLVHPGNGERLYRTGDLGRYLPSGDIEFLGRRDFQVKIQGYRIELGEIESALAHHPGLRDAVVAALGERQGSKRLAAFLVAEAEPAPAEDELRRFLSERLPAYMVPVSFHFLDALPLGANGKLDRKALAELDVRGPRREGSAAVSATPTGERLAAVFAEVLGVEKVGPYDNFYELGGDSILAIRTISRAAQEGLQLDLATLYTHPTVAELTAMVKLTPAAQADQSPVVGEVSLTPVQHWFFEQGLQAAQHWNQAVLLKLRRPVTSARLAAALDLLLAHHDALRLRFVRRGQAWHQHCAPPGGDVPLHEVDLSRLDVRHRVAAMESCAARVQASLDLGDGPVLRMVLFQAGADEPPRLLWTIHHLVVDGISWRILLEDLETACTSPAGRARLPLKTASFKAWAEALRGRARSSELGAELDAWLALAGHDLRRLPIDLSDGVNVESSARSVDLRFTPEDTRALLEEVPKFQETRINDLLLGALAGTLHAWAGGPVMVDLEGHGREADFETPDVSRTVGWFTAIHPVSLEIPPPLSAGGALTRVREQLGKIPGRGLGYGLLRYLSDAGDPLRCLPAAEVSFNYLGQFDQVLDSSRFFAPARESPGPVYAQTGPRRYLLGISGSVTGGCLELRWTYSENLHRRSTIKRLAGDFRARLLAAIAHCRAAAADTAFDLVDLDRGQLEELTAMIDDVDRATEEVF